MNFRARTAFARRHDDLDGAYNDRRDDSWLWILLGIASIPIWVPLAVLFYGSLFIEALWQEFWYQWRGLLEQLDHEHLE